MIFSSFEYIFVFLPVTFVIYFLLNKYVGNYANIWLVLASLFFYSWWNVIYLPLLLGSMTFNFLIGTLLNRETIKARKRVLILGITCNVLLLCYFKYADFFISNMNDVFSTHIDLLHTVLPLGISFFTFTQIAFLVDTYRGETAKYKFSNYALFVTFFPHLIAGPILHHRDIMPQFASKANKRINWNNLSIGLFIFSIGLFKKVVIADTFSRWVAVGFDESQSLSVLDAWTTSILYTLQLYFDFSGYTDMAIGGALLFNIKFPINFNSPYLSLNIQDFWRRWHITLSNFLREYIYIPLGGNRKGEARTYINLLVTFIIGGFWHGAGWTFIFWGFLHGAALVIHRIWKKFKITIPKFLAWFITFNFINITWVFFRANSWEDAMKVIKGMLGLGAAKGFNINQSFMYVDKRVALYVFILAIALVFIPKNSNHYLEKFKPSLLKLAFIVAVIVVGIFFMNSSVSKEFLYYDF